jgi:hypothetical protein
MSTRKIWITALALGVTLAVSAPASRAAEGVYISPMIGWTTAANLELGQQDVKGVKVAGGRTWGGQLGVQKPGMGFEVSYMQQESHISVNDSDRVGLQVGQLHANFLFEKIRYDSRIRPYFLLGLGATFFNPDRGFDTVSRFSFALGGGLMIDQFLASDKLGLKIQAKYNPTYLSDDWGDTWCDPFYCYQVADPDYLDQGEFSAGLTYKFGR